MYQKQGGIKVTIDLTSVHLEKYKFEYIRLVLSSYQLKLKTSRYIVAKA